MKVFLFGSMGLGSIPAEVEKQLEDIIKITSGDVEFIVGDAPGIDTAFHMILSRIGAASKTKVYCTDYVRNNKFDFKVEMFDGGDLIGRELFEAKDRHMINDCDFAICVWNGESKGTFNNISILKVNDKPVYIYRVNIY